MPTKFLAYKALLLALCPQFLYAVPANSVVATINVGVTPSGLAITPDNNFAYVANNNNYGLPNADNVSVLNLTNNLPDLLISSTTFNEPYTITINAAGTLAYVTNSNYTTVSIIDIPSNTVSGIITGFDGPSGLAITPDGTYAYVNNYGGPEGVGSGNGKTVNVVDLTNNTIVKTITVDQAPAALAVSPDGDYVYVINYVNGTPGSGTMNVIQTSDNTVTGTVYGFFGPFDIAITPDGNYAYVTNFGSNNFFPFGTTVNAVDLTSNTITATITLGIQPAGIAITPDGNYAYVTNYNTLYTSTYFSSLVAGQGTVNVIDIATNTVIPPTIVVDQSPANIAISPNGEFAYVSNYTSNTINVIALPTFEIAAQGCQIQNRYLTQMDVINKITWTVSGTSLPVSYDVYRDAALTDLAGTVLIDALSLDDDEPFVLLDHNRNPDITYTYYIVGTNSVGTTSEPVAITVTQNC